MIVVMANGCFDLFHSGHVAHLREARALGDVLIVTLTRDEAVKKSKGLPPINNWEDRASVLRELRCVDQVLPSSTLAEAVLTVRPDILAKGIDYEDWQFSDAALKACEEAHTWIVITRSPKKSAIAIIAEAQRRVK